MDLYKYLGLNVKIDCEDETLYVKVIGHTSKYDNEEPDDDGNYSGEYISVEALKPTKHFNVGGEFIVMLYDINKIEIIN